MLIIPAIDLKDGRCVRLLQGDFDRVTDYSGDPAAVARSFSAMGFGYLHVVDLDGAKDGSQQNQQRIAEIIAASDMSVQVGGGIRSRETVRRWLDAGVTRCVIGSAAVTDPDFVKALLEIHGSDRLVLALDVRINDESTPLLAINGWTRTSEMSLWDCIETFLPLGIQHVLCTDVSRDGALSGPNISLYSEIKRRYPDLKLQASGGVRGIDDLTSTAGCGAYATITGRALLDGRISQEEISQFLQNA